MYATDQPLPPRANSLGPSCDDLARQDKLPSSFFPFPCLCDDDHLKIFHKMYATFSHNNQVFHQKFNECLCGSRKLQSSRA